MPSLQATIRDVARKTNLSVATVSRALASSDLVARATRDRVFAAAQLLGYSPNPAARSLVTGKTGNLGVIVPDLNNPFYPNVVKGAQARAHQCSHSIFVADGDEDPAAEESLVQMMAKEVDGVIVCAPFASDEALRKLSDQTSLVLINRSLPGIPAVLMDFGDGMMQVIRHLAALGHRRCAFLNGPSSSWSACERRRGIGDVARKDALEMVELGPYEPKFEAGFSATDDAVKGGFTAIVAYNDLMALGVLRRLATLGIRVPDDMSVVGFDDVIYAAMCAPALTTVEVPMGAAGRAAVDILLGRCPTLSTQGPPAAVVRNTLPTRLVIRASTAPPAGC